jgi:hypothetical protein
MSLVTFWMFANVRDASINSLGFCDAMASASCDPMLFGEIPVMTTVNVSRYFEVHGYQSNAFYDSSNGVGREHKVQTLDPNSDVTVVPPHNSDII